MKRLLLICLLMGGFCLSVSAQVAIACVPEEDYYMGDYYSTATVFLRRDCYEYPGGTYYDWDDNGKSYYILARKDDPLTLASWLGEYYYWWESLYSGYPVYDYYGGVQYYDYTWDWTYTTVTFRIKEGFGEACMDYYYHGPDCFEGMFKGLNVRIEGIQNLSMYYQPISLKETFMNCNLANEKIDFGYMYVSSLENTFLCQYPDYYVNNIKEVDFSHVNTSSLTSLKSTFAGCKKLTTVKTPESTASYWDLSNVTDMSTMFNGCVNLRNIDVSNWNTSNVTDISYMFSNCYMLETLNTSKWDLRKLGKASYAFYNCWRLKSLTFGSNFKLSHLSAVNVTNMFQNMYASRYIDFFASNDVNAINESNFDYLIGSYTTYDGYRFSTDGHQTVIYLPHGSDAITDKMNVVYSYNNDQTDLRCYTYSCACYDVESHTAEGDIYKRKVNHGLEFPRTFKTNAAYYSYPYGHEEFGSVILPYEFVSNNDAQAFTLHHEVPNKMYLEYSDRVPAHTPFIYQNKRSSKNSAYLNTIDETDNFGVTVYATHTTAQREGGTPYLTTAANNTSIDPDFDIWSAKGFYVTDTLWYNPNPSLYPTRQPYYTAPGQVYYIKNNKFVKAMGEHLVIRRNMALFYGYWTMGIDAVAGEAKEYSFEFGNPNGEMTGIDGFSVSEAVDKARTREDDENIVAIYDISGHRLKSVQKGVNVLRMKDGTTRKLIKE